MSSKFKVQSSRFTRPGFYQKLRTVKLFYLLPLIFCFLPAACSMPNLEKPECTESRIAVKEFYSYHFGNEMKFSPENLKEREKFLTPELIESLRNTKGEADVFTTNDTDYPKAFSVGGCEVVAPDKTVFQINLFWKDQTRSEQRQIKAEAVKRDNKWLINKILN